MAILVALFSALAVVGFGASAASAEATLVSSTPADGEQLTASPVELRLVFSESVSAETTVTVACNGAPAPVGPSRLEADTVTVVVPVVGAIGKSKCNVVWNVPNPDGGNVTGLFAFDVTAEPAPTTEAPDTADTTLPPTDETDGTVVTDSSDDGSRVGGPLGLARLVSYIAIAALFGGIVLIALAWPEGVEYAVTLRYLRIAWIVGLSATILQVALTTAQLGERSALSSLSPAAWGDLMDTTPGRALLARMLLIAAAGWVALRPERVLDPANRSAALALPALVVATWGFSRTGGDLALVGLAMGVFHALSTAIWFGGLMLLSRVVLLGPGDEDLVHAVRGYVRYSTTALVVAVATGAVQTYRLDSGALFSSSHGRLLVLKVAGVAAMAYIAMAARPVISHRLDGADHMDGRTASSLRRAVSAEMMIGVVVLAFTSWMMATQPANLEASSSVRYQYDSGRSGGDLDVRVRLTSQEVGRSGVRIEVFAPPEGLVDLRVTFRPPAGTTASAIRLEVPLTGAGAAELPAAEGVPFTAPGEWTIEIEADGPDGRFETVTDTVVIEGDPVTPDTGAPSGTDVPSDTVAPDTTDPTA
jgi:copper transport protein